MNRLKIILTTIFTIPEKNETTAVERYKIADEIGKQQEAKKRISHEVSVSRKRMNFVDKDETVIF